MIVEYHQRDAVLAFDDPNWKPPRSTRAAETQLEDIDRFCTVPSSSKLEELRLAFGTLAREIQEGVEGDQDWREIGVSPRSRTSGDDRRERDKISSDPAETEETKNSTSNSNSNIESGLVHLPQAGATEDCNRLQGGTRQREVSSSFRSMPPNVGKKFDVASKVQHIRSLESNQEDTTRIESMVRLKAVVYTPAHDITEVGDGNSKQELTRVRAELESERRSTQAARRALQEAQRVAEEALVERDRFEYVVKTFEERSQKESSAESQSLKQQVRESERSLVEARLQIDAKTREMMEVLERAADLGEALKKERAARVAAVEEQKKLTRHLRTCLRDRAKAEEEASKASKALQQSKMQMESLTRRLEVLRSAKKRLDKKVAAAAPGANSHGEVGSATTGVHDRLVEARARLRTLSTLNFIDNGGNAGTGHGSDQYFVKEDPTKTAVEIALKTALLDKKWTEKLHDAEKRGEAYRSAALATEAEKQKVVKEREKLAEKNRILSERLAEFSREEYPSKCKQDTESVATSVATTRTEKFQFFRETNSREGNGTKAEVDFKTSSREIPEKLSPAHRSLKICKERGTALLTTPTAPPMTSNGTHEEGHPSRDSKSATALEVKTAEKANDNRIEADRKTTRRYTPRTARSNSLDAVERPVPFRSWCNARPRSASQEARPNRDAPCIAHGQHETAMFNHLLTDSRRLRVDVLHAVRNWPWREGQRGSQVASRPSPLLQAPAPEKEVVSASAVGIDGCDRAKDASIAPVPIAVLLRLCDRSARLAKGERENILTQVIKGQKETLATGCEYGVLGVTRLQPTTDAEEPAEDDQLLPPGVSAALARQVRCAVSKGDETGFLQIIGQCGSTTRWGIARLLAINPS